MKVVGINEINESIEEIIIKFFDTNIPITKYIITNFNEGFKFSTGSNGDCTDCQFKSDETNFQSILVECKDGKDKSSDCNLEFQENVNLWNLNKYNQGVILLKGIVNVNFTPLQNTWPF